MNDDQYVAYSRVRHGLPPIESEYVRKNMVYFSKMDRFLALFKHNWTVRLEVALHCGNINGIERALLNGANVDKLIRQNRVSQFFLPSEREFNGVAIGCARIGQGKIAIQPIIKNPVLFASKQKISGYMIITLTPAFAASIRNNNDKRPLEEGHPD